MGVSLLNNCTGSVLGFFEVVKNLKLAVCSCCMEKEGYSETSTSMTSHRIDSSLHSQCLHSLQRQFGIVSSNFIATALYEEQFRTLVWCVVSECRPDMDIR